MFCFHKKKKKNNNLVWVIIGIVVGVAAAAVGGYFLFTKVLKDKLCKKNCECAEECCDEPCEEIAAEASVEEVVEAVKSQPEYLSRKERERNEKENHPGFDLCSDDSGAGLCRLCQECGRTHRAYH